MTQPALSGPYALLAAFGAGIALFLAVWALVRLLRARAHLERLHHPELAELALRADAEAVLAARLERGEIGRAEYARALLQLGGAPPPAGAASGGTADDPAR